MLFLHIALLPKNIALYSISNLSVIDGNFLFHTPPAIGDIMIKLLFPGGVLFKKLML